jgi:hypothetical protein
MTIELRQEADGTWTCSDTERVHVPSISGLPDWVMESLSPVFGLPLPAVRIFMAGLLAGVIERYEQLLRMESPSAQTRTADEQRAAAAVHAQFWRAAWQLESWLIEQEKASKAQSRRRKGKGKLTEAQEEEIRNAPSKRGVIKKLALEHGVSEDTIGRKRKKA